jgi:hypothetical protein
MASGNPDVFATVQLLSFFAALKMFQFFRPDYEIRNQNTEDVIFPPFFACQELMKDRNYWMACHLKVSFYVFFFLFTTALFRMFHYLFMFPFLLSVLKQRATLTIFLF